MDFRPITFHTEDNILSTFFRQEVFQNKIVSFDLNRRGHGTSFVTFNVHGRVVEGRYSRTKKYVLGDPNGN